MSIAVDPCLEHYVIVAPLLVDLLPNDFCVAVTDTEKYLLTRASKKINLNIAEGSPLKPGTSVYKAIHENRRIVVRGDKAVFGVPYIAYAYPITDQAGTVIGCLSVAEPVDKQDHLKEMARNLSDSISVFASTTEEISAQTQELAAVSGRVVSDVQNSNAKVEETGSVLQLIKDISSQTNLLGLNAAIEAARVGDQGRGFGVVAEEIRKLAATSADSVKQIEQTIKAIQIESGKTFTQIRDVENGIEQIAKAITQVAAEVEKISDMAQRLDTLSDDLCL